MTPDKQEVPLIQGWFYTPDVFRAGHRHGVLPANGAGGGDLKALLGESCESVQGESWLVAASRFVSYMRAAAADETKPHASEEQHFWGYATGKHIS